MRCHTRRSHTNLNYESFLEHFSKDVIMSWTMKELKEKLQQVDRFDPQKMYDLPHLRAAVFRWAKDEAWNIFFKETDELLGELDNIVDG